MNTTSTLRSNALLASLAAVIAIGVVAGGTGYWLGTRRAPVEHAPASNAAPISGAAIAKATADARPIPAAAAVTNARLPFRRSDIWFSPVSLSLREAQSSVQTGFGLRCWTGSFRSQ